LKKINILSLCQAYRYIQAESYKNFLSHYSIEIRNYEVDDLISLVKTLYNENNYKYIFNLFYVGYKIPQIGKEFDLLRIDEKSIINIELKRTSDEETIYKQLKRNKYYLNFIDKKIYNFSFVSDKKQLYFLNENNSISEVDPQFLLQLLEEQQIEQINNIDNLFDPSDYLVSPFNSTDKFTGDEYFLTHQQEEIKENILNTVKNDGTTNFIAITGSAGTGKTLLVYDIAKEVRKIHKKALIVHCGNLNNGQHKLNNKYNWEIIPIKKHKEYELSKYSIVIIDEAQRIRKDQLEKIINKIRMSNSTCIFSYDKLQTLSKIEESINIENNINNIDGIIKHNLSEKIRTNKEISLFIKAIFNKKKKIILPKNNNIVLNYFKHSNSAKEFLSSLNNKEWEVLRFTPSQFHIEHHENYSITSSKTSHEVIGQEFDGVAVTIDELFSYNKSGELIYKGRSYYHSTKMFFQNITRTRKRLNVVIINNSELLDRCLSILQDKPTTDD